MGSYRELHKPCPHCSSSDALVVNEDGSTKCFSCKRFTPSNELELMEEQPTRNKERHTSLQTGYYKAIPDRGITKETCEAYGVTIKNDVHLYPFHNQYGELIAQKARGKDIKGEKIFSCRGNWNDITLFGQANFRKGGKYITLC